MTQDKVGGDPGPGMEANIETNLTEGGDTASSTRESSTMVASRKGGAAQLKKAPQSSQLAKKGPNLHVKLWPEISGHRFASKLWPQIFSHRFESKAVAGNF